MVFFCSPEHARLRDRSARWAYLGKDAGRRARLGERLGKAPASLGSRLHEELRSLRGPFLELVASSGKGAGASWWAGTLPWRAQDVSDLFLLIGYLSLCRKLAAEPAAGELVVVVEDPWLLEQLRRDSKGTAGAAFSAVPSLRAQALRFLFLGLARRLKWLLRSVLGWLAQFRHSGLRAPRPAPGSAALYSHLMRRFLPEGGGWSDPFLAGLDGELEAAGVPVARITYPDSTGFEAELSRRPYAVPLILHASVPGMLRALLSRPPALGGGEECAGMRVDLLLGREWWFDFSRAGRCAFLLLFDCARRFFARSRCRALFLPWENLPQEKMLVLAAREAGVRTVGYQHTTVPEFQTAFFIAKGEPAPLPDVILTSGEHPRRALAEGGIPESVLRVGGTRRYGHLLEAAAPERVRHEGDVLIILPIDAFQSRHLLAAVRRAYPEGGKGFRFLVRAHPSDPIDPREIGFPCGRGDGPLDAVLAGCGVVVFTGSTAGLDAFMAGHAVLRYRPETLVDCDPCDMFGEEFFPTVTDLDLCERLDALLRGDGPEPSGRVREVLRRVFSPLDPGAWKDAAGLP